MLRQIVARLGLVLTLLSAGCGESAETANPPTDTTAPVASTNPAADTPATSVGDAGIPGGVADACSLLSTEGLAAAVGGSWGEPRNVPGAQSVQCDFVDDSTRTKFFVAVYSQEAIAGAGGPEAMLASLAYPGGSSGTEIDAGEGSSFFFTFPNVRNFVVMLVDGEVIQLSGETTFGIAFDEEGMTAIARAVADNL